MPRTFALVLTICLLAALVPPRILGQQVTTDPASTHIFPAGGRRGTAVEVRIGGECLPPQTRLRFLGDGISASDVLGPRAAPREEPSPRRNPGEQHINYPKEWTARLEIEEGAPLGPRFWWLACARGGTAARAFLVGDLPEFIESESNSLPQRAESVQLPVTINGQIAGERDRDYFRFSAQAGEVVVADVAAARLGSPLEAVVEFWDAAGKRLEAHESRVGSDPVVALRVPVSGEYRLSIANLGMPGGPHFVYRVTLSSSPYARLAYPPGGVAGQKLPVQLLTLSGTPELNVVTQELTLPMQPMADWQRLGKAFNQLPIDVGLHPEIVEQHANDTRTTAAAISMPVTLNGRIESAADEDWYRFEGRMKEPVSIECRPAGDGLPLLAILSVHSEAGTVLASASAIDTPDRRPCIEAWTPPADGPYWLRIRDVQQGVAGGPEFVYRVTLQGARPDFELSLKSGAANLVQGGRAELEVFVRRRGGFAGPVSVSVEGLPAGVRAEPLEIPATAPSGKLMLLSDEKTSLPDDALLRILGAADIAGAQVTHDASLPHLSRDAEGVAVGPASIGRFHLTVQNKPLFRLFCSEAYQYAHRGTIYPYLMQVERLQGFDGPIRLEVADRQIKDLDGIEVVEVTIPPGESRVMLPLYLPETMHINVQAHSNVYAQGIAHFQDAAGREQSTCVVSEMRCMVRTLPTVARLRIQERELTVARGSQALCRLHLDRTPLFAGPLKVSLLEPKSGSGITAEPIEIPAGQSEATISVRFAPNVNVGTPEVLKFRGTGELGGGATVVSEAQVTLRLASE